MAHNAIRVLMQLPVFRAKQSDCKNISNTSDSVSSGYPNNEKIVNNYPAKSRGISPDT